MKTLLLLLVLTASLQAAEPVDVLVQGAEKLEIQEIIDALGPDAKKRTIGRFSFWTGRIGEHRVAVSLTGQAVINCTVATVIGIEEFRPKLILNQGTSGAQRPGLGLHDIVVGSTALDYGNYVSPVRGTGEGSNPLGWTPVPQSLRDPSGTLVAHPEGFKGDAASIEVALRTANSMGKVVAGVIGSAHEVNLELDRVEWSHRTFGMDVEEMESGHVAAIAHAYGIRFIAFRVVSDAPYELIEFQPEAAHATARFTVAFLRNLPAISQTVDGTQ